MVYLIIVVLISRFYCEWCWEDVKTGKRKYEDISQFFMFMYYLNYGLALVFSSLGCLIFASTLALYQMVIFKKRVLNLNA